MERSFRRPRNRLETGALQACEKGRRSVIEEAGRRRAYYLAKIKEAEDVAARATSHETIREMETMIEGYRRLLGRLPPATDSEH